jgi:hypothetical protein
MPQRFQSLEFQRFTAAAQRKRHIRNLKNLDIAALKEIMRLFSENLDDSTLSSRFSDFLCLAADDNTIRRVTPASSP